MENDNQIEVYFGEDDLKKNKWPLSLILLIGSFVVIVLSAIALGIIVIAKTEPEEPTTTTTQTPATTTEAVITTTTAELTVNERKS